MAQASQAKDIWEAYEPLLLSSHRAPSHQAQPSRPDGEQLMCQPPGVATQQRAPSSPVQHLYLFRQAKACETCMNLLQSLKPRADAGAKDSPQVSNAHQAIVLPWLLHLPSDTILHSSLSYLRPTGRTLLNDTVLRD